MLQRHQITTHTNSTEATELTQHMTEFVKTHEVEWLYIMKATSISRFEKGEMVYYSGGASYTRLAVWQEQHLIGECNLPNQLHQITCWVIMLLPNNHRCPLRVHVLYKLSWSRGSWSHAKLIWWSWLGGSWSQGTNSQYNDILRLTHHNTYSNVRLQI